MLRREFNLGLLLFALTPRAWASNSTSRRSFRAARKSDGLICAPRGFPVTHCGRFAHEPAKHPRMRE